MGRGIGKGEILGERERKYKGKGEGKRGQLEG